MDVSYKTHAPLGLSENRVPKSTELYYVSNIAFFGVVYPISDMRPNINIIQFSCA